MGAAAAAENPLDANNVTMNSIDDTTLVVSEDAGGAEQLLGASGDGTFTDLKNLIDTSEDILVLDKNYKFSKSSDDSELSNGILILNKNITITSNDGITIDANNSAGIFYIENSTVLLKNIVLKNAKSTHNFENEYSHGRGGAIFALSSNLTCNNCTFIGNTAIMYGGAIYVDEESQSFNADDCSFINNNAESWGGAVATYAPGMMTNCEFISNYANILGAGALLIQTDSFNLEHCNFADNWAKSEAGAVFVVVSYHGVKISYCNFTNNTATNGYGGAFATRYDSSNVALDHCNFNNNSAISGGAISITGGGHVKISDTEFNNNSATDAGGAIFIDSKGNEIINSTFTDNTVNNMKSSINSTYSMYNINNTCDDSSFKNVGQLVNRDFYVSVDGTGNGTSFSDCANWTYAYNEILPGHTIFLKEGNYTNIINQTIDKSISIKGKGKVILDLKNSGYAFIVNSPHVNIDNITFMNGFSTTENAGAIIFYSFSQESSLINCIFINNSGNVVNDVYYNHYKKYATSDLIVENNTFYGHYINYDGSFYIGGESISLSITQSNKNITANIYINGTFIGSQNITSNFTNSSFIVLNNFSDGEMILNVSFTDTGSNNYLNTETRTFQYFNSFDEIYVSVNGTSLVGFSEDDPISLEEFKKITIHIPTVYLIGEFNMGDMDFKANHVIGLNAKITGAKFNMCNVIIDNITFMDTTFNSLTNLTFNYCKFINFKNTVFPIDLSNISFLNSYFENSSIKLWYDNYHRIFLIDNCTFISTVLQLEYSNFTFKNSSVIKGKFLVNYDKGSTIENNCFINNVDFSVKTISSTKYQYNWHGSNAPSDVSVPYLEAKFNATHTNISIHENYPVLDVYFVKNGTDERVDVLWSRPVNYTINEGENVNISDNFTNMLGKVNADNKNPINISAKVDNQNLGSVLLNPTEYYNFIDLARIINGYDDGQSIELYHNFTFNETRDNYYINGIPITKSVIVNGAGFSVDANNIANSIFNITADDVVVENITVKNTKNIPIISTGDNTALNNITSDNISGVIVNITADNPVIRNITVNDGAGIIVNVTGNNPTVLNITSDRSGDLITINGNGTQDSLIIDIDDVTYPKIPKAVVTSSVDGKYNITINEKTYTVNVVNGEGTVELGLLAADEYSAIVKSSQESFNITGSTEFTVNNATIESLNVTVEDVIYPNIAIAVVNANKDGQYIVVVNDKEYTVNVAGGTGNVTLDLLHVNSYPVTVRSNITNYVGENNASFIVNNGTITVSVDLQEPVTWDENATLIITTGVNGTYTVNVNGINYTVEVTNGVNGTAILNKLPAGMYNVTVTGTIENYNPVNEINITEFEVLKINTDLTFQKSKKDK